MFIAEHGDKIKALHPDFEEVALTEVPAGHVLHLETED